MEKYLKMKWFSLFFYFLSFNCLANWDFRGHHREILSIYYPNNSSAPSYSQVLHNSRINGLYKENKLIFDISYDLFLSYNIFEDLLFKQAVEKTNFLYRIDDLDNFLIKKSHSDKQSTILLQNLDRLNIIYNSNYVKTTVGRQAIGLGTARMVNPLDILVPFDFVMINLEERLGVDAIRVTLPVGELSEIDGAVVFNEENSTLNFLTFSDNLFEIDYKLYLMNAYHHQIWGFDLQSSIWEIGTWLEFGNFKLQSGKKFNRLSFGGHYFFKNDFNLLIEYHFNGAGTDDANQYVINYAKSFQKELGIFLLGRNYANLSTGYQFSPLQQVGLNIFCNLNDDSLLLSPSYEYNLDQNWYFSISSFLGLKSKIKNAEFANYPKILTTNLKYFF